MSTSASSPHVGAVHRRPGVKYSLDLQAPADLTTQPHVEILHGHDDPVGTWEPGDL